MSTLPNQSYFTGFSDQRLSTISPRLVPSALNFTSPVSRRPSKAPSRSPPTRAGTPIRHHRPSVSRARSGRRPDALLAYASEQQHQPVPAILPSQSNPANSQMYPPSAYMMATTTASAPTQTAYYGTSSIHQFTPQYLAASSAYAAQPSQTTYYGLTRSASQPTLELPTVHPQDALFLPNSVPSNSQPFPSLVSNTQSFPPHATALESSPESFRVISQKSRPQCFDHGCNGRQFSTFSNLLRHQREKSVCPHCGTEFTRTTARNGHLWGGKCKGRTGDAQTTPSDGPPSATESE